MIDRVVECGQMYENVGRPRRQWQVVEVRTDNVKLERADSTNVIRLVPTAKLLDTRIYVRRNKPQPSRS